MALNASDAKRDLDRIAARLMNWQPVEVAFEGYLPQRLDLVRISKLRSIKTELETRWTLSKAESTAADTLNTNEKKRDAARWWLNYSKQIYQTRQFFFALIEQEIHRQQIRFYATLSSLYFKPERDRRPRTVRERTPSIESADTTPDDTPLLDEQSPDYAFAGLQAIWDARKPVTPALVQPRPARDRSITLESSPQTPTTAKELSPEDRKALYIATSNDGTHSDASRVYALRRIQSLEPIGEVLTFIPDIRQIIGNRELDKSLRYEAAWTLVQWNRSEDLKIYLSNYFSQEHHYSASGDANSMANRARQILGRRLVVATRKGDSADRITSNQHAIGRLFVANGSDSEHIEPLIIRLDSDVDYSNRDDFANVSFPNNSFASRRQFHIQLGRLPLFVGLLATIDDTTSVPDANIPVQLASQRDVEALLKSLLPTPVSNSRLKAAATMILDGHLPGTVYKFLYGRSPRGKEVGHWAGAFDDVFTYETKTFSTLRQMKAWLREQSDMHPDTGIMGSAKQIRGQWHLSVEQVRIGSQKYNPHIEKENSKADFQFISEGFQKYRRARYLQGKKGMPFSLWIIPAPRTPIQLAKSEIASASELPQMAVQEDKTTLIPHASAPTMQVDPIPPQFDFSHFPFSLLSNPNSIPMRHFLNTFFVALLGYGSAAQHYFFHTQEHSHSPFALEMSA